MKRDIEHCLQVLKSGGIILYPTDTVWGIGCDATDAEAIDKIFRLKKRTETKSMIILLAEEKDIFNYVQNPPKGVLDILKSFTTATTVIFEKSKNLPKKSIAADGSVAIRITQDSFCKTLIQRLSRPIISTSANISGHKNPQIFKEIDQEIIHGVDYVVNYRQDDEHHKSPSRIIKINADGSLNIIRS